MQEMEREVAFDYRTDKVYPDPEVDKMMRALEKRVCFGNTIKQVKAKQIA